MTFKALVEMERFSVLKTELNKSTGRVTVDRVIQFRVPCAYGFIENTMADDGDALDVFILGDFNIPTLTEVTVVPRMALICEDNGVMDEKIIATIEGDGAPCIFASLMEIKYYLENYKPGFKILQEVKEEEAISLIEKYTIG